MTEKTYAHHGVVKSVPGLRPFLVVHSLRVTKAVMGQVQDCGRTV